ncbi:MAG: hypothetical protein AB7T06_22660, partial [Kofleriaceae bacterium]
PMLRSLVLVLLVASTAHAEPKRRVIVDAPAQAADAAISNVLYLERCAGGCVITKGSGTDARNNSSSIPAGPTSTLSEFVGASGVAGAASDEEWNAVVECVREVYSPYQVTVTDQRPAQGAYHMAILAGLPSEVGLGNDILGISPLASDCSPIDNAISFSFANHHSRADPQRVYTLCWTVAQESAHAFGLDHTFEFADGTSTCSDPMTYRSDCGGQRFFRNFRAKCGENQVRACRCGQFQNSHEKLVEVFGAATATTPAPAINLTLPQANVALSAVGAAQAGSKRGVARVDLYLNGSKWSEVPGASYGVNGQPPMASYTIPIPTNVPGPSKYDVFARACDDIGNCTDSNVVPSFKGDAAGCASSEDCADEQTCEDGYCRWPAASGAIGDECNYAQFCVSNVCAGTTDLTICTRGCTTLDDDCPNGLVCVANGGTDGVCFVEDTGGCCNVGRADGSRPWVYVGFSVLLFAVITRRSRRGKTA